MRDPLRHRCEPRCTLKIGRGVSMVIDTTNKNAPSKSGRF
ncbi:DUF1534 domain-containing protein [Pseudomonas congelans]|nr:DUF1534 domain-containing protein [Pseudomonas congelans]